MNNNNQPTRDEPIARAIAFADMALSLSTGHADFQRRKIAYYAVATRFLRTFDPFPGLVLYGPPSTGKTATLNVLRRLCWHPVSVTGETITPAALKQSMNDANEGTLIIEEGDRFSLEDLEGILITRYSRSSAGWRKMISDGRDWVLHEFPTFGATILHRRNLFRDPALLRRVITIRTSRRKGDYASVDPRHGLFRLYEHCLRFRPRLPEIRNAWEIEPGVFECYRPLVTLAIHLEDIDFVLALLDELKAASLRLKREETYLEAPTLLKVLIGLAHEATKGKFTHDRVNVQLRRLPQAIFTEFGPSCPVLALSANQRNRILEEDLGFTIRASHGRNRVYLTIPQLIEKCDEYGVEDDLLDEWRKELKG